MKKYSIQIQGWVYAMTAYGASKRDALNRFKQQHDIDRMPRGFAIWESN